MWVQTTSTITSTIHNTAQLMTWGSDVEVLATATLLQTTLVVYSVINQTARKWLPYKPLFMVFGTPPSKETNLPLQPLSRLGTCGKDLRGTFPFCPQTAFCWLFLTFLSLQYQNEVILRMPNWWSLQNLPFLAATEVWKMWYLGTSWSSHINVCKIQVM